MKKHLIVLISGVIFLISSCTKATTPSPISPPPPPLEAALYDFFPLKIGNKWTYDFYYKRWKVQSEQRIINGEMTWLLTDSKAYGTDSTVYNVLETLSGIEEITNLLEPNPTSYTRNIDTIKIYRAFTQLKDQKLRLEIYGYDNLALDMKRFYPDTNDSLSFANQITPPPIYNVTLQRSVGVKSYKSIVGTSHSYTIYQFNLKKYSITP